MWAIVALASAGAVVGAMLLHVRAAASRREAGERLRADVDDAKRLADSVGQQLDAEERRRRLPALRKIVSARRMQDGDERCASLGLLPRAYVYEGAQANENALVAADAGCVPMVRGPNALNLFCCPESAKH